MTKIYRSEPMKDIGYNRRDALKLGMVTTLTTCFTPILIALPSRCSKLETEMDTQGIGLSLPRLSNNNEQEEKRTQLIINYATAIELLDFIVVELSENTPQIQQLPSRNILNKSLCNASEFKSLAKATIPIGPISDFTFESHAKLITKNYVELLRLYSNHLIYSPLIFDSFNNIVKTNFRTLFSKTVKQYVPEKSVLLIDCWIKPEA